MVAAIGLHWRRTLLQYHFTELLPPYVMVGEDIDHGEKGIYKIKRFNTMAVYTTVKLVKQINTTKIMSQAL